MGFQCKIVPCIDSDLALRSCLLTSDMNVKIGDYGLSHSQYKVPPSNGTISVSLFIVHTPSVRSCSITLVLAFFFGKEDYFVTPDQIWVPLRWIAPELIDEVHGNLLVVDQTKTSNVW